MLPTVFCGYPETAEAGLVRGQARLDDADEFEYSFERLIVQGFGRPDAAFQATSTCLAHVKDDAQKTLPA